jgi:deoxyribodipyrimidine photo-lyase
VALFVAKKLADYSEARSEPEVDGTSALSPWLHFGQVSVHEVFAAISSREKWQLDSLGKSVGGAPDSSRKAPPFHGTGVKFPAPSFR